MHESLIQRDSQQMELLSSSEMEAALFADDEAGSEARNPEFTAVRYHGRFPERYQEIVALRAEMVPVATIARMFRVSRNTVAAIDRREMQTAGVEHYKQRAAWNYRQLADLGHEQLREILLDPTSAATFKKSPHQLAVMIAVLQDKAELLSGGVTQRVEVVSGPQESDFTELMRRAREMMGQGGGKGGQKGDDGPGADREPIDAEFEMVDQAGTVQSEPAAGDAGGAAAGPTAPPGGEVEHGTGAVAPEPLEDAGKAQP